MDAQLGPTASAAALLPFGQALLDAGALLAAPIRTFEPDKLRALGWAWSDQLSAPIMRGMLRVEATTSELGKRLSLEMGVRKRPLVCNDDPLECFAGDLNGFADAYAVSVVGWPDDAGQIFVEEAAPLLTLPELSWRALGTVREQRARHPHQ